MTSKKPPLRSTGIRRPRSRSSGITLTELLIAVSLAAFVSIGFAALYGTAQSYLTDVVNSSEAQGSASFALQHLSRSLRQAVAVRNPSANTWDLDYQQTAGGATVTMRYQRVGTTLTWYPNITTLSDRQDVATNITALNLDVTTYTDTVAVTITATQGSRAAQLNTSVVPRGRSP